MSGPLIPLSETGATGDGGLCEMPAADAATAASAVVPAPRLTLISFPTCPFVQRAVIALKERGVDFDVVYIDLADKPDWFLKISPLGKVPVLKVEAEGRAPAILFESTVILQYLDETLPGPTLFAADPLDRAVQRAWVEYAGSLLGDVYRLGMAPDRAGFDEARAAVRSRLAPLEEALRGPYFSGAAFSAVDAACAPAFRQLDALETLRPLDLFDGLPRLDTWRRVLADRPSVRAAVPADFRETFLGRLRSAGSFVTTAA